MVGGTVLVAQSFRTPYDAQVYSCAFILVLHIVFFFVFMDEISKALYVVSFFIILDGLMLFKSGLFVAFPQSFCLYFCYIIS